MSTDAQLVVSNGLFTHYKRLDRIVPAMTSVLAEHPEAYFLLLGREHPSETFAGRLMRNLVDQASLTSLLQVYLDVRWEMSMMQQLCMQHICNPGCPGSSYEYFVPAAEPVSNQREPCC